MPVYDDYKFGNMWGPGLVHNVPLLNASANLAALTSGTLLLIGGITVPAFQKVSNIAFVSGATAAGTPTHQWFTIVDAITLKTLRSTADATSAAWAANTVKALALSSAWTPTTDTIAYVGIMVTATTVPTLIGAPALQNSVMSSGLTSFKFCGNSNTGATTPLADNTTLTAITAGVNVPLCALS
jgi:hypothetical protein